MPERSPEIEQEMRKSAEAIARGDIDEIDRHTSREDCVLSIGSDPKEWAEGHDDIMQLMRESMPEGDLDIKIGLDEVKAFREGNVGWVAARGNFELEGTRVPVRITAVVLDEDGEWRMVQNHASIGVPNENMTDPMFQAG